MRKAVCLPLLKLSVYSVCIGEGGIITSVVSGDAVIQQWIVSMAAAVAGTTIPPPHPTVTAAATVGTTFYDPFLQSCCGYGCNWDYVLPRHAGARGDDGNSLEGRKGGAGVSRAVRGSKRARFFSSGIDLARAARVRRRRIGYWRIARAGSYKGCIRAQLDSRPLRRYDAASGRAEILELILGTAL